MLNVILSVVFGAAINYYLRHNLTEALLAGFVAGCVAFVINKGRQEGKKDASN